MKALSFGHVEPISIPAGASRVPPETLIVAYGIALYAQEVLVPEMAMLLVKEDMSFTDAESRSILEESTEIGETLIEGEDGQVNCQFHASCKACSLNSVHQTELM